MLQLKALRVGLRGNLVLSNTRELNRDKGLQGKANNEEQKSQRGLR